MASIVPCRPCKGVGTIRKGKACARCAGTGKVLVEVVDGRVVVVVGPVVKQ